MIVNRIRRVSQMVDSESQLWSRLGEPAAIATTGNRWGSKQRKTCEMQPENAEYAIPV